MTENAPQWVNIYRERAVAPGSPLFVSPTPLQEYVMDLNGTPYLDFTAADGVMVLGQGNGYVAHQLREAVSGVYYSGSTDDHVHGSQLDLMRSLVQYFGEKSQFLLRSSDTEAFSTLHTVLPEVEPGLSIGVLNRKRPVLSNPYQDVAFLHYEYPTAITIDALGSRRLKAILVCPIDPDTYEAIDPRLLERAIEVSEEVGIPIVWDETVLGAGWSGAMFSTPDYARYAVLGGALGGGLPLGVIVDRQGKGEKPYRALAVDDIEDLSSVFAGNALACSAALATINALALNLQKGGIVYPLVEKLDDELLHLQKTFPEIVGLTGDSLKRGIRFKSEGLARAVRNQCAEDGLLLGWSTYSGNVVTVTTSLANTTQDVAEMAGIVLAALMKVMEKDDG